MNKTDLDTIVVFLFLILIVSVLYVGFQIRDCDLSCKERMDKYCINYLITNTKNMGLDLDKNFTIEEVKK